MSVGSHFRKCLSSRSADPVERASALLGCPPEANIAAVTHNSFSPSDENELATPQLQRTNIGRRSSRYILPRALGNRWARPLPARFNANS